MLVGQMIADDPSAELLDLSADADALLG